MAQTLFSAGAMYGVNPDGAGAEQFGYLQSASIDFNRDVKTLHGERQFPAVAATGMSTITGRATWGRIFGAIYADLFFGETLTSGAVQVSQDEDQTIPDAGYFVIDVDEDATFLTDLGVYDVASGSRMTFVDSMPATGEYSVVSGTYTFAAADHGKAVRISYLYTAATGKLLTINNNLMGITPSFKLVLFNPGRTQRGASPSTFVLNNCTASKLTIPLRLGEFGLPEFDFMGYADESEVVGLISTQD